jgi:hypothetical protein
LARILKNRKRRRQGAANASENLPRIFAPSRVVKDASATVHQTQGCPEV